MLGEEGVNELPSSQQRGSLRIAFDVMREPMFLLLAACGAIYLAVGDLQEALMLLAFVFFVMGITLYQEGKTERALEALRDLSSPRALVIRDGTQQRIAGREVVRAISSSWPRGTGSPPTLWCLSAPACQPTSRS